MDTTSVPITHVIDEQEALEAEASHQEQQDWGSEGECTWAKGYVRQPVWVCKACSREAGRVFGLCYGCHLRCHLDHGNDMVELFDRRRFRCDCCTKVNPHACSFHEGATPRPVNVNNVYEPAHNWEGRFCWCDAEYDVNDKEQEAMFVCTGCLEWYHESCIRTTMRLSPTQQLPPDDHSFLCDKCCIKAKPFLPSYAHLQHMIGPPAAKGSDVHDVRAVAGVAADESVIDVVGDAVDDPDGVTALVPSHAEDCLRSTLPTGTGTGPVFMSPLWKKRLCACSSCVALMQECGFDFLLTETTEEDELDVVDDDDDDDDSDDAYDSDGDNGDSDNVVGDKRLGPSSSSRVGAVGSSPSPQKRARADASEAVPSINLLRDMMSSFLSKPMPADRRLLLLDHQRRMEDAFKEYFRPWAAEGRVVTESDVRDFFASLKQRGMGS